MKDSHTYTHTHTHTISPQTMYPHYLSTPSDHELLVGSDVSNEHTHESQLFTESYQHKQATGVEGNAVGFFWKLLVQV